MAQENTLKRYLDAGMAFTAMTQAKAEALVKELVKAGEVQTEQAQATVTDLLDRSRKNTEEFLALVRKEIVQSADSLGLATVADLTRVEKLIEAIKPGSAAKKTTAKKTTAKKAAAKKAPAKKAAAATKTAAKKAPAKKTTAKKTAAAKAPAKKAAAATESAAKAVATKAPAKKTEG